MPSIADDVAFVSPKGSTCGLVVSVVFAQGDDSFLRK